jgi:hypothetical protein
VDYEEVVFYDKLELERQVVPKLAEQFQAEVLMTY